MDPATDDHLIEVGGMIRNLCSDSDAVVSFFDNELMV